MSEFCVKCAEKDAQIELLQKKHYEDMKQLREHCNRLQDENDRLSLDLAFYEGHITNLSCNNK